VGVSEVINTARLWAEHDPDPETRSEMLGLIEQGDAEQLEERMGGSLEFGTAGLRGRVEAGSNRMNRAVVIRTTWGLAQHLLETIGGGTVVVGRDARLSSPAFQDDTVGVLAAAGLDVLKLPGTTPTPVVAFTAKQRRTIAAVVVTASHNPPADNGYKVYSSNAVQIIPPRDHEIAAWIDRAPPADEIDRIDPAEFENHERIEIGDESVFADYREALLDGVPFVEGDGDLSIVYSAMHGVGGSTVMRVLEMAGFESVTPVDSQFEPDGTFPTVAFPNPEEPGAMDQAHGTAAEIDAGLVIANDPDADRLAVSLPTMSGWRQLTGNQIGSLLADFALDHSEVDQPLVVESVVSSPMLRSIAEDHGARFERTLTGFKWICNAALDLESQGLDFVFGYEEALGYTMGTIVRDKDGIGAALAFVRMVAESRHSGETMWDRLGRLYRKHGLWVSTQKSVVRAGSEGAEEIASAMARLADARPEHLGGHAVTGVTDYRVGAGQRPRWLGATPLVEYDIGEAGRALIRPSGTEPKIKIYVDLRAEAEDDWRGQEADLLEEAGRVASDLAAFAGF
jgi:phosphomannomutase